MMKDTFFNANRFGKLLWKDLSEDWKKNLMRFLVMYGVILIVLIFMGFNEYSSDSYKVLRGEALDEPVDPMRRDVYAFRLLSLFAFAALSGSLVMERLKSKVGRIRLLTFPATSFEKFFSRWLTVVVLFAVLFVAAHTLADWTRLLIFKVVYPELTYFQPVPWDCWVKPEEVERCYPYYFFSRWYWAFIWFSLVFTVQSFFILGGVIVPKNSFIKTFVVCSLIVAIFVYTMYLCVTKMIDPHSVGQPPRWLRSEEVAFVLLSALCWLFTLTSWVLAYFRFKEAEVINRM